MNKILESLGVEAALLHEVENLNDMVYETDLMVLQQRCERVRSSLLLIANRASKLAEAALSASTNTASHKICPCCDGDGRLPDRNGGTKRCEHCKGKGKLQA